MLSSLLVLVGAVAGISACAPSPTVSLQLQDALEHPSADGVVRLGDLTDFEWEAFVALGPYTTREAAEAVLDFPWPEFEHFGLESSDHFSLLVFTSKGSVVRAEKHPRCKPDFAPDTLGRLLSPAEAVVSIETSSSCPVARAAARQGAAAAERFRRLIRAAAAFRGFASPAASG